MNKLCERIRSSELYTRCELCGGSCRTKSAIMVDSKDDRGRLPAGSSCPCADSPTPGYSPVGITLEYFESMRLSYEAVLVEFERAVLELKRLIRFPGTTPDPAVLGPAGALAEKKAPQIAAARRAADVRTAARGPTTSGG